MVFINLCVLVHWAKVAIALEGLSGICMVTEPWCHELVVMTTVVMEDVSFGHVIH